MVRTTIIAGALALLAAGTAQCAGDGAGAAVREWPVAVRTLTNAPAPAGYHVFRSATEWRRALQRSGYGNTVLPRVDWDREMVIAVSMGQRPTAGYRIDITSVKRVGNEVLLQVREASPAPDAMVAQVLTHPTKAVAVKRLTGPFVFVVNGTRKPLGAGTTVARSKDQPTAPAPGKGQAPGADDRGLATSVFVVRESGGIAGLDRQTVVHLFGRPLRPGEVMGGARETREARSGGPLIRLVENTVRDSGFMDLENRYAADRPVADGMTRTIRVIMDGKEKTVSVTDGAIAPKAFEDVWAAIQTAINSKGTIVRPAGEAG